jgi:cell division protein FtsN
MSREAELYKDKIEVSLDGRQIFYLFFGGSVIVGLVFVLGVMVGRRVEARGHVDRARVAATVDPLAALDRLEGGNGLSFQGALRGNDAPASDVEKQIAALESKPAAAKLEKKTEAPKIEKKAEAPKVEAKVETSEEPKADHDAEPKVEPKVEKKAEAPEIEPKVAPKVEPKIEKKADEAKVEKKADEPKKDDKKRYTLQLSAFQDKADAEALAQTVKAGGYEAYISEGVVDGKQYLRVRTGTYRSQDAANAAKSDIEKVANKSAIVTRI